MPEETEISGHWGVASQPAQYFSVVILRPGGEAPDCYYDEMACQDRPIQETYRTRIVSTSLFS